MAAVVYKEAAIAHPDKTVVDRMKIAIIKEENQEETILPEEDLLTRAISKEVSLKNNNTITEVPENTIDLCILIELGNVQALATEKQNKLALKAVLAA